MTIQEQIPISEGLEIVTEKEQKGFMHKIRSLGKKSTAQAIEDPSDFYVNWPFTD